MLRRFQFLLLMAVFPFAVSILGDTVTLRNGTRFDGTFVAGSPSNGITFRDGKRIRHHFAIQDVQSLEFASSTDATLRQRPGRSQAASTSLGTAKIIPSGTEIAVRSSETIDSKTAAVGQYFPPIIEQDIFDSSGTLAIPKGSGAQLVIRKTVGGSMTDASELVLDIDSVSVSGRRYLVSTGDVAEKGRQGLGTNKRTAEMVGGGAAIGALIGAIAGHGKGAAIGAAVGAGAGVRS